MEEGSKVVIVLKHVDYTGLTRHVGDVATVSGFPGQAYGICSEDETMLVFHKSKYGSIATPNEYFVSYSKVKKIVSRSGREKEIIFR